MSKPRDTSAQLFLTFAELEFLLRSESGWSSAREAWLLPAPVDSDETAAAGLASLAVRGLVTSDGDDLVFSDELAGARTMLASVTAWFRVAQTSVAGDLVFAGTVGVGDPSVGHVVVSSAGLGCFEVVGIRAEGSAAATIASVGCAALLRAGDGELAFGAVPSGDIPAVTVRLETGRWSLTDASSRSYELTEKHAVGALAREVSTLLSGARS